MRYVRIKNIGLIAPEALHLVGATSKRNDNSKIGQFGSGNKYALAYFLRNNYEVKVFSGLEEIKIDTVTSNFRGTDLQLITVNGIATSITTDMGNGTWEFWQAIREFYCNAIDEGGHSLDFVADIAPNKDETHFYFDLRADAFKFLASYDDYFAFKKKVLFECSEGRILEKSGTNANIYRKGIRCYDSSKASLFDYDFNDISISEDRAVKYYWDVEQKMWDLIFMCTNKDVIMQILHRCTDPLVLESSINTLTSFNSNIMSSEFKECLQANRLAPESLSGLLTPEDSGTTILLPTKLFNTVRGVIGDGSIAPQFKTTLSGFYRDIPMKPLWQATVSAALDFLNEVKFKVEYPISAGLFDDKDIGGYADSSGDGRIVLSDLCLERGVNLVIIAIIEEFIHLKYKAPDNSRGFQTAIISEFVTYMKNINAYNL